MHTCLKCHDSTQTVKRCMYTSKHENNTYTTDSNAVNFFRNSEHLYELRCRDFSGNSRRWWQLLTASMKTIPTPQIAMQSIFSEIAKHLYELRCRDFSGNSRRWWQLLTLQCATRRQLGVSQASVSRQDSRALKLETCFSKLLNTRPHNSSLGSTSFTVQIAISEHTVYSTTLLGMLRSKPRLQITLHCCYVADRQTLVQNGWRLICR